MIHRFGIAAAATLVAAAAAGSILVSGVADAAEPSAERGEYVFHAAGCAGCHTQVDAGGALLAGGRRLVTPYGTFVSPNITPDRDHGIGTWSQDDFVAALREGRIPGGGSYYPAFPYTSYTGMSDRDAMDLFAYLRTVPAVARANEEHELDFPFGFRPLMTLWRWLFFEPARFVPDPARSEAWNRGAYIVRALGHCGECHTPRNRFGVLDRERPLAGGAQASGSGRVPPIHPAALEDWSTDDIAIFLADGFMPDGDFVGGDMAEVVEQSTGRLSPEDREAIATFLKGL